MPRYCPCPVCRSAIASATEAKRQRINQMLGRFFERHAMGFSAGLIVAVMASNIFICN